jgi:hypothetical protein
LGTFTPRNEFADPKSKRTVCAWAVVANPAATTASNFAQRLTLTERHVPFMSSPPDVSYDSQTKDSRNNASATEIASRFLVETRRVLRFNAAQLSKLEKG